MSIELIQKLQNKFIEMGYDADTLTELRECLMSSTDIDVLDGDVEFDINNSCWYRKFTAITQLDKMFISYEYGQYFGENAYDIGNQPPFDWDKVKEVEPYTEVVVKYRPKKVEKK